jgi:hypothetical protein
MKPHLAKAENIGLSSQPYRAFISFSSPKPDPIYAALDRFISAIIEWDGIEDDYEDQAAQEEFMRAQNALFKVTPTTAAGALELYQQIENLGFSWLRNTPQFHDLIKRALRKLS